MQQTIGTRAAPIYGTAVQAAQTRRDRSRSSLLARSILKQSVRCAIPPCKNVDSSRTPFFVMEIAKNGVPEIARIWKREPTRCSWPNARPVWPRARQACRQHACRARRGRGREGVFRGWDEFFGKYQEKDPSFFVEGLAKNEGSFLLSGKARRPRSGKKCRNRAARRPHRPRAREENAVKCPSRRSPSHPRPAGRGR